MPTYDYLCNECGYQQESLQKISDAPLVKCPACQNDSLRRGPGGGIGLQFQGSGFYITDYGSKTNAVKKPDSTDDSKNSTKDSPADNSKKCGCGKSACQK